LSANSDAPINLEYLMEDIDFNKLIKREEYYELIKTEVEKFRCVLERLKN